MKRQNKKKNRQSSAPERITFEKALKTITFEHMKRYNIQRITVTNINGCFDFVCYPDIKNNFKGDFVSVAEATGYYMMIHNITRIVYKLDGDKLVTSHFKSHQAAAHMTEAIPYNCLNFSALAKKITP